MYNVRSRSNSSLACDAPARARFRRFEPISRSTVAALRSFASSTTGKALSLFIGKAAYTVELEVKAVLPAPVRKAVDRSLSGRERAKAAEAEAAKATELAVKAMLAHGLSTRDAGELLGLSRQRVHQVASGALVRNERQVG